VKTTQKHVFSTLFSKCCFKHFRNFSNIFPHFKAKFGVGTLFCQVCHFLGVPKLLMDSTDLYLTLHCSTITHNSLTVSRKWLCSLFCLH
jgi:hypothetical protein